MTWKWAVYRISKFIYSALYSLTLSLGLEVGDMGCDWNKGTTCIQCIIFTYSLTFSANLEAGDMGCE